MGRLTGHFQNAARLWLGTEDLRQRAAVGEHAMDTIELGIVAIDARGHLRYANHYAETLLREGKLLAVRHGKLSATLPGDTHQLQAALQQVATSRHGLSLRLGSAKRADTSPCDVAVVPIGSTDPFALRVNPATLLLLISQVRHRRTITVQQLMVIFGLTPAEARLARALGSGESMTTYAEANEISINTLKTQLKGVFAKTGMTRQAELARLIAIIPVLRQQSANGGHK